MLARVALVASCLVAAGCGFGTGTGQVIGTLFVRGCSQSNDYGSLAMPAGYAMNPTFFVADPIDSPPYERLLHPVNRVNIRVQAKGEHPEKADVMWVTIADVAPVAAALGTPLPLGPATNVRANLKLSETCHYAESGAELDGTITFSAFGSATGGAPPAGFDIGYGDRLAATFTTTVVDRRALTLGGVGPVPATPAVSGMLTGSFDFIVRAGKAAEGF